MAEPASVAWRENEVLDLPFEWFNLSTRTANVLRVAQVRTLRELAALRSTDVLKWQSAGVKTLAEIRQLLSSVNLKLADDGAPKIKPEKRFLPAVPESALVDDELECFVKAVDSERNSDILLKLWGWSGARPRTLDSVGKEYNLTRERVRQIEKRALDRFRKHKLRPTYLSQALAALRSLTPDTLNDLSRAMQVRGLTRNMVSVHGLQRAAEHFGVKWPLEYFEVSGQEFAAARGEAEKYLEAVALVRKRTSDRGCINVLTIASELLIDEAKINRLRRVLDIATGLEWLDDEQEWIFCAHSPRNRLLNLCAKVFGVAPSLYLSELRTAVTRSHRLAMCPPQRVLAALIRRSKYGDIDGTTVISAPAVRRPPSPDSSEGIMVRVLDEFGPALDGEVFAERCVAAGMNPTTFYVMRSHSPVVCALAKTVYCKVGTSPPPGTVEDILARRRLAPRVLDYGWTRRGALWFGMSLRRQVITAGGIRLPRFVADLVQGDWRVVLPDATEYDTVTCRDIFIWSFRKAFLVLGAEPADMMALEFDLKRRRVCVRLGGPELFGTVEAGDILNGTDQDAEDT